MIVWHRAGYGVPVGLHTQVPQKSEDIWWNMWQVE